MPNDDIDKSNKPHSADYFGESRDFWWNKDFLQLMAKRLELSKINKILDVGCGVGHWNRALSTVLPKNTQIFGIDLEDAWISEATKLAVLNGLQDRSFYQKGDALNIPFPDNTFDMVTCQTLLIHLQNPDIALREFIRVLKPNGILLIAESSSVPIMFWSQGMYELPIDKFTDLIKFQYTCEIGKDSLGLGWNSQGEFVAGFLAAMPVADIQVFLSDKCNPLFPEYNQTKEQEVISKDIIERDNKDMWIWDKATTKNYFIAGLLKDNPKLNSKEIESLFIKNWNLAKGFEAMIIENIKNKKFSSAGASVMYLTTAKKSNA